MSSSVHAAGIAAFLVVLVGVAAVGVSRTRERRREVETARRYRRALAAAQARIDVSMPRLHPENPARPGFFEEILHGDQYTWFTAQLPAVTDIEARGDLGQDEVNGQ